MNEATDIASRISVRSDELMNCRLHLLWIHRQLAEPDNVRRIEEAFDVFVDAKDRRSVVGRVAANAFKHAEAVLHGRADEGHNTFTGRSQRIVNPDVTSSSHDLLGESWNPLRLPALERGSKRQDSMLSGIL